MARRPHLGIVVAVVAVAATACAKKRASPSRIACFDVTAGGQSASTRALFAARHCQGGGVTWAPILEALARRRGRVVAVEEETPGWGGAVFTLDGRTRFSVDDEADAARFCSDDAQLLSAMRRDQARLDGDAAELRRAMAEASAGEMECLEADGSVPPLPKMNPMPQLPPTELAATRDRLERVRRTIARQPAWCFPPDDREDRAGVLRFGADGSATLSGADGKVAQRGRWQLPPPAHGDSRVEVMLRGDRGGMLLHLDVGPSGRLGIDYLDPKKTIREELIPGDECLRAR